MKSAKKLATCLTSSLIVWAQAGFQSHSAAAVFDPHSAQAGTLPAERLGKILEGSASLTQSVWAQYFESGQQALENCQFHLAEQKLSMALAELRKRNASDLRLVETKTELGEALLGEERTESAERTLTDAAARAERVPGGELWHARALSDLAQAYYDQGKLAKAEQVCREALAMQEHLYGEAHHDVGKSREILATILGAEGLEKASAEMHHKAIAVLEKSPGVNSRDLATAEYGLAMALKAQGEERESESHFQHAFAIQDKLVHFNRSMDQVGKVTVRWEPGNPHSRQIADADYPLWIR